MPKYHQLIPGHTINPWPVWLAIGHRFQRAAAAPLRGPGLPSAAGGPAAALPGGAAAAATAGAGGELRRGFGGDAWEATEAWVKMGDG